MQNNPNRNLYMSIGIAILLLIALNVTVIKRYDTETKTNIDALSKKERALMKVRRGRFLHIQDALDKYRVVSDDLKSSIENSITKISFKFHDWVQIPEGDKNNPGFYFRKRHAAEQDEINIQCTAYFSSLDDQTLGFDNLDDAIDNKKAEENLAKLSITRKIIELLAQSGVPRIISVRPQEPVLVGPKGHDDIMREYPVTIRVKTGLDALMKFLHSVRRPGEAFLVVRSLTASSEVTKDKKNEKNSVELILNKGELDVHITVAGMAFLDKNIRERSRTAQRIIRKARTEPLGH